LRHSSNHIHLIRCLRIDTARIDTTLETLNYLLNRKGPLGGVKCIVLIAHLGQPTGNYNRDDFTLFPAVAVLKKLLGRDVIFLPDCVGASIEHAVCYYPSLSLPFSLCTWRSFSR
jgi:3-phosphoglycerate kinase